MAFGFKLGLGLSQRGGGGAFSPVLSAFGAGSTDDLELDPPAIIIEHNTSGTLTGDFHFSATPPAKEAGDIGFFTTSLSGDAVTDISTALNTFLDLHPGETGYLHFRLTNAAGDSDPPLTTQVITVPAVAPSAFVDADWSVATGATTGGQLDVTIATLPSNGGATITDVEYELDASGTWVSSGGTTSFTITGLTASTSYAVRLRAVNSAGSGAAGNSESATSSTAASASEIFTNGSFATDTDWTKGVGWSITGGQAISDGPDFGSISQAITVATPYALHKLEMDIASLTAGQEARLFSSDASRGGVPSQEFPTSTGTHTRYVTPEGASPTFYAFALAQPITFNSLSLVEQDIGALSLGSELVSNGDFAAGTGWSLFNSATISGGLLNLATTGNSQARQDISITGGTLYLVTFDVNAAGAGNTVQIRLGADSGAGVRNIAFGTGAHSIELGVIAGSTYAQVRIIQNASTVFTVDNFSVRAIS